MNTNFGISAADYLRPKYVILTDRVVQEREILDIFKRKSPVTRKELLEIQETIESWPDSLGEDPFPLFHSFADGMYTREMHVPALHFVVGKIHKNPYFVNVMKGRLFVISEFGCRELTAPCSFAAQAGVKHIGLTMEDTVWSDVHKVDSTTVKEAEEEIFAVSYEDLDEYNNVYEG